MLPVLPPQSSISTWGSILAIVCKLLSFIAFAPIQEWAANLAAEKKKNIFLVSYGFRQREKHDCTAQVSLDKHLQAFFWRIVTEGHFWFKPT